jgi:hypothetical protein
MKSILKVALALTAGGLLLVASLPASAQSGPYDVGPSGYRDVDGSYRSIAAYTRDVEGIPCGINCTLAAQQPAPRDYYGRFELR